MFWVVLLVAEKTLHSCDLPAIAKAHCAHACVNLLLLYLLCDFIAVKVQGRSGLFMLGRRCG